MAYRDFNIAKERNKLPPIDRDLKVTLTKLYSAGAFVDSPGITFTGLTAYLRDGPPNLEIGPQESRELFLSLRKCTDAKLVEMVKSPGDNGDSKCHFRLTCLGQDYEHEDNSPPGWTWHDTPRYSANVLQRENGRIPRSRGER